MATVDLTNENFDDLIEKQRFAILDFWADWCGPCHQFAPSFQACAEVNKDILFGKINTVLEAALAKDFEIFSVPTLLAIDDGTIVYARPGALTPEKLERLVQDLRSGQLINR